MQAQRVVTWKTRKLLHQWVWMKIWDNGSVRMTLPPPVASTQQNKASITGYEHVSH